jgi:uncharacterized protein YqfA (UPF0365 family)
MNSILIAAFTLGLLFFFWRVYPTSMFITVQLAGTPIPFVDLLKMKFRNVAINKVCNAYILLKNSRIEIELEGLEKAFLEGRDLENVTRGLVLSKKRGTPLTFEQAKEADKNGVRMTEGKPEIIS